MAKAVRRLSSPSVRGCSMGSCAPVSTTGMGMPRTMKDSTEAVYAMVSVPWEITTPSKPSRASKTCRAMSRHSSGWILDESRWRISRTVRA